MIRMRKQLKTVPKSRRAVNWGLSPIICLALALACGTALAEKADKDKPLNLEANSASYDDEQKVMVAEGAVVVTKGTLIMRATKIVQRQDAEENQYLVATGSPKERVFFRQKREGLDEFMEGEADRIEYDGKTDVLKLMGRAIMRRLRGATVADESTGNLIEYNNVTEFLTLNGAAVGGASQTGKAQGRVRMMLTPKPKSTQANVSAGSAAGSAAPALKMTDALKP